MSGIRIFAVGHKINIDFMIFTYLTFVMCDGPIKS